MCWALLMNQLVVDRVMFIADNTFTVSASNTLVHLLCKAKFQGTKYRGRGYLTINDRVATCGIHTN